MPLPTAEGPPPGAPVLLVNPPSPRGLRANREGMGGIGVLGRGRKSFVYPAESLARVAGVLEAGGRRWLAFDFVLSPLRSAWRWRRLAAGARGGPAVVQVSRASLESDLAWVLSALGPGTERSMYLLGPGLAAVAAEIRSVLPGAAIVEALDPGGHEEGLRVLARRLGGIPDADSDWRGFPKGRRGRLPIRHARGCHEACLYCPYVLASRRRFLPRDPGRTAEEHLRLTRDFAPRRLVYRDPVFGLDPASYGALLDILAGIPAARRAPFEVETRPELLDEDLVRRLAAAGGVEVKLGVETLDAQALLRWRRVAGHAEAVAYAAAARAAVARLQERRIAVRLHLLRGLGAASDRALSDTAREFAGRATVIVRDLVPPTAWADRIPPGGSP
jgi:hypothetical protein